MVKSNKTSKRKINRKRQSGFIGFKVFLDTDQDIIDWWEEVEPGKGSDLLRQIIRDYMMQPKQQGIEQLTEQIDIMRRELLAKLDSMSQQLISRPALPSIPQPDNVARISKEEKEERKDRILKNKW